MSSCDTNYALSCLQKLPALSGLADEAKKYHRSDVFGDMYLESFQLHDEHDLTEYITATLTQFFDQVIEGSLSLDVAVMKMMMVMDYTNYPQEYVLLQEGEEVEVGSFDERYTVDQVLSLIARGRKSQQSTLRQVLKDNLFNNLKVLLHFMFVSVFGMSANQMIIDKNCTNNKLYEYFICEYVPKFRKDHIWFKYCGTKTHVIHGEIQHIINHEDIALLIADYTYVYFDDYFEQMSYFLDLLSKDNEHFQTTLIALRRLYVVGRTDAFPLLFGCLLSDKFIVYDTSQQSLLFSIHEMVFKYAENSSIICEFFSHHSRYTFWNNAAHVIQWIENIFDDDVDHIIRFMGSIIQKQITTAARFLQMFEMPFFCLEAFDFRFGIRSRRYGERTAVVIDYDVFIDELYVNGNIDVIFERLIDKYFGGYDETTMRISLYLMKSLLNSIRFMITYATLYPVKAQQRNIEQLVDKAFGYLMSRFVTVKRFDWKHSNNSVNNMFRTGPIEACVRALVGFDTAKAALLKCKYENIFNVLRTKQKKYQGIDLLLQAVEEVEKNQQSTHNSERMPLYEPQRKK
eukprot:126710_1